MRKITQEFSFIGKAEPLTARGFQHACDTIGISPATLTAVIKVETRGCGFLRSKRPSILFERHVFARYSDRKFNSSHPQISGDRGGYGHGGEAQYDRLLEAMRCNVTAALYACSWGIGQIMGYRYEGAGYDSVDAMIFEFCDSEDMQLLAMARFIRGMRLDGALRSKDWSRFATGYNGPLYSENKYDERLQAAYDIACEEISGIDFSVRAEQMQLMFDGYYNGAIDGVSGPRTESARVAMRNTVMRA